MIIAGKASGSAEDLASQPTVSRFDNRVAAQELRRHSV